MGFFEDFGKNWDDAWSNVGQMFEMGSKQMENGNFWGGLANWGTGVSSAIGNAVTLGGANALGNLAKDDLMDGNGSENAFSAVVNYAAKNQSESILIQQDLSTGKYSDYEFDEKTGAFVAKETYYAQTEEQKQQFDELANVMGGVDLAGQVVDVATGGFTGSLVSKPVAAVTSKFAKGAAKIAAKTGIKETAESVLKNVTAKFTKSVVKEGVEEIAENTAATVTKNVVKEGVEEVAEEVAENTAKTAAKEVTQELVEEGVETTTEKIGKEAVEEVVDEASEKAVKETGENVAQETAEKITKEKSDDVTKETINQLNNEAKSEIAEEVSDELAKKAGKKGAEDAANKLSRREMRKAMKEYERNKLSNQVKRFGIGAGTMFVTDRVINGKTVSDIEWNGTIEAGADIVSDITSGATEIAGEATKDVLDGADGAMSLFAKEHPTLARFLNTCKAAYHAAKETLLDTELGSMAVAAIEKGKDKLKGMFSDTVEQYEDMSISQVADKLQAESDNEAKTFSEHYAKRASQLDALCGLNASDRYFTGNLCANFADKTSSTNTDADPDVDLMDV